MPACGYEFYLRVFYLYISTFNVHSVNRPSYTDISSCLICGSYVCLCKHVLSPRRVIKLSRIPLEEK